MVVKASCTVKSLGKMLHIVRQKLFFFFTFTSEYSYLFYIVAIEKIRRSLFHEKSIVPDVKYEKL